MMSGDTTPVRLPRRGVRRRGLSTSWVQILFACLPWVLIGAITWREQVPLGDLIRSPMFWTLVAGMALASWFFLFVFREKAKWFRAEREGILRRRRLRGLLRPPRVSSDRVTSGHRRAGVRALGALLLTLGAIGLVWVVVFHLAARCDMGWGNIVFLGLLGTIGVCVIREMRRWSSAFRERRERRRRRRLSRSGSAVRSGVARSGRDRSSRPPQG